MNSFEERLSVVTAAEERWPFRGKRKLAPFESLVHVWSIEDVEMMIVHYSPGGALSNEIWAPLRVLRLKQALLTKGILGLK